MHVPRPIIRSSPSTPPTTPPAMAPVCWFELLPWCPGGSGAFELEEFEADADGDPVEEGLSDTTGEYDAFTELLALALGVIEGEYETFPMLLPVGEIEGEYETFTMLLPVGEIEGEYETFTKLLTLGEIEGEYETFTMLLALGVIEGE
eukprot:gb/GECG01012589.1/.p1 GENE.gb/GECG01012589.1/~~gb/GECG01012589.1/.p1  ORF type:complete len:148 (+),score=22.60 gb/GECG01012589.1/:1-444(+)